ncbi:SusC/RagA family TonB-linked outer membrane protein [Pedobacter panaciterrae]|uniref:SusC/RagA family TonB-linked outer membrane protein n=1 Tax=Pedobacter panaciterrae TaxID=363849 RepID=A0ABU8NJ74_9SPHI
MPKTITFFSRYLLLVMFSVMAMKVAAQNTKNGQIPLSEALTSIQKRFDAKFAYEQNLLAGKFTTTSSLKGKQVEEVLKNVLYPNNLIFLYVSEHTYSIVARNADFFTGLPGAPQSVPTSQPVIGQAFSLRGTVVDTQGQPVTYANVWVKGTNQATQTNDRGGFLLPAVQLGQTVSLSSIGYNTAEVIIATTQKLDLVMTANFKMLNEVNVVSNGYQQISKDRAPGSAVVIDAKKLKDYPSPNVLQRLEGLVPGLQLNVLASDRSFTYQATTGLNVTQGIASNTRTTGNNDFSIAIRGTSNLGARFSESSPLIVVDGAITEIDLSALNPNDIQTITFLKDAAAASIWGVRAANGVMVITTKRGSRKDAPNINFSTNVMFSGKPDLDYMRMMNSAQQLAYEKELVDRNILPAIAGNTYFGATQVVSQGTYLAQQLKAGTLTQAQYDASVSSLSTVDNRSQVSEYLLRAASNQQYNLSVDGGTDNSNYYYSVSYSNELPNVIGTQGKRLTATLNNTWKLFNYATLNTSLKATFFNYLNNGQGLGTLYRGSATVLMPYQAIADGNGNGLSFDRLNPIFTKSLSGVFRDWRYNYLDELANADNTQKDQNYVANINLKLPIIEGLSASVFYNMERTYSVGRNYYNQQTYFFRNLINYYTYPGATNNSLGITNGGILSLVNTDQNNYSLRGQVDLDRAFDKHRITALAGTEIRETNFGQGLQSLYGYNPQTGQTNSSMNFSNTPTYAWVGGFSPTNYTSFSAGYPSRGDRRRRFLSYYSNFAYTFNDKYTLSGSVRYDDYNNFGLDRKYRATPLWSGGLKWNATRENFLKDQKWLNSLAFRATYGVNGNLSLYTYPYTFIAVGSSDQATNQPSASIQQIANPQLRWEKTYQANFGVDFSMFSSRLSGTMDYYEKRGRDLFFEFPISAVYVGSIGNGTLIRNTASMNGKGVDIGLNGILAASKDWSVNTGLTFSYNTNKVIDNRFSEALYSSYYGYYPAGIALLKGYPTDKLLVYRNAGLDANGLTQVYGSDGNIIPSTQSTITDFGVFKNAGRMRAPYFGGLNASVRYKAFTLMSLLTYQFGSVFLKPTIQSYITSTRLINYDLSEVIAERWQRSGDEAHTVVPGLNGGAGSVYYSQLRYQNSDINVLKGDYIRLRQLGLTYQIPQALLGKYKIRSVQAGFAVNNLGLLWTANKEGFDPDFTSYPGYGNLPAAVSYNLSLNVNF